jgi:hypothetical protein
LTHFNIRHCQDHLPVTSDPNERVWNEGLLGRSGLAVGYGQAKTKHKAAASGCSSAQESPTGQTFHSMSPIGGMLDSVSGTHGGLRWIIVDVHGQPLHSPD